MNWGKDAVNGGNERLEMVLTWLCLKKADLLSFASKIKMTDWVVALPEKEELEFRSVVA